MAHTRDETIARELERRFQVLRSISDGWYDGQGFAPAPGKLELIAAHVVGEYPEGLPLPAIVPTPEGNLLFEWDAPGEPSVDLRLSDMKAEFHAFHPGADDVERDFDLSAPDQWHLFFDFLLQEIGGGPA